MDSLRGPARSTVVKTLREYLEVEWEVRKGSQRSFGKDVMRGSSPRVPQQDNFSDCGVYVLQYVESFFEEWKLPPVCGRLELSPDIYIDCEDPVIVNVTT
ncbi:unnamed protein product [Menidia menidia]|uniref:(Atlantic silverside) hypothetical protein n=1 Tax=Menidia menidia TaxID=238744 RepID=A0A8S4AAU6_9TELE|nr:unnamed protein product [Menidia menidia]